MSVMRSGEEERKAETEKKNGRRRQRRRPRRRACRRGLNSRPSAACLLAASFVPQPTWIGFFFPTTPRSAPFIPLSSLSPRLFLFTSSLCQLCSDTSYIFNFNHVFLTLPCTRQTRHSLHQPIYRPCTIFAQTLFPYRPARADGKHQLLCSAQC